MKPQVWVLATLALALAVSAGLREGFVIDDDLVDELTAKRVHIRLYDEFVERHGRRPDQGEYEDMIALYQARFRDTGIHPRVADIVPRADGDKEKAEEGAYWAFYALVFVALAFAAATVAYVAFSSRSGSNLY